MAAEKKRGKPEQEDPVDTVAQQRYWESSRLGVETPKTTTATLMTYPGWDELLKDLAVKTPEMVLNEKISELKVKWDAITAPHSPLTPEAAATDAFSFEGAANLAHAGLVALITAIEAAGFGQLESPAYLAPSNPALGAMFDAAREVRKAYFNGSFITGLRYWVNARFQPTVVPADALISAYNMGLIDKVLYNGLMLYHGFTVERGDLMAKTQVRMPDLGTILELTRRGVLTTSGAADWLVLGKMPRATANAVLNLLSPMLSTEQLLELYRLRRIGSSALAERLLKKGYTGLEIGLLSRLAVPPVPPSLWAQAAQKQWVTPDYAMARLMEYGYTDEEARLSYWLAENVPSLETVLTLKRRGLVDAGAFESLMKSLMFPGWAISALKGLESVVPPLPDLVTMAVREAFPVEPGPPQYAELAKYGAMHGLSAWWTERYRYMAMIPMDLRQAYENLWRGFFDKTAFFRYLRIADIHERDWEAIYRVAFTPPTVRELGYGYDVGVYAESDIATYRRWGGLSAEDASKAARAMVEYRTAAEKEAVRREYLALFARRRIGEDEFRRALAGLATPAAALELWVKRGTLQQQRMYQPETPSIPSSGEAALLAEWGLITEGDLSNLLIAGGMEPYWAPKVAHARMLGNLRDEYNRIRTTLTERFREGFIKEADFKNKLASLGFAMHTINASVQAANEASTWDDIKEQAGEWWRLAKAGKITPETYANEARALGMTEARITRKIDLLRKLAAIPKT